MGNFSSKFCLGIFQSGRRLNDETPFMSELGPPPPWFIFIIANYVADLLRKMADKITPPQIRMLEFGFAQQKSALAYVIQKYKIAEFIGDGNGPKSVQQIATYTRTKNVAYIERFMYACASIDMFKIDGEKRFSNTSLSAVLRRDHPNSMAGWIGHHYEIGSRVWCNFSKMFGPKGSDILAWNIAFPDFEFSPLNNKRGIWDMYDKNPHHEEQFTRMMEALEGLGGLAMASDGPFEGHSRFIDIGGSRGHFLTKLLKMYRKSTETDNNGPKMTSGILFDLPSVINIAKEVFDPELRKDKRITFCPGDFFKVTTIPKIRNGDCIYLRYILHDWGDHEAMNILRNLRLAIDDKRVSLLIGESAMPDRDRIGTPPAVHSIDMEMLAYFGGASERCPSYWKKMLNATGFSMVAIHSTRSLLAWVEARPM